MSKLHPIASVSVTSTCVLLCLLYIVSSTQYRLNAPCDGPATHYSLRFSTFVDYPLEWSGVASRIRPGSYATARAVMQCCNAPCRLFSAMLAVLWSWSAHKCPNTGHVTCLAAFPNLLQGAGSWLLWAVLYLPCSLTAHVISILAVFSAAPLLLCWHWQSLANTYSSLVGVNAQLHTSQAASSDTSVTGEHAECAAHCRCSGCAGSSSHGHDAPSILIKVLAVYMSVWYVLSSAMQLITQSLMARFITHVTAPLLHTCICKVFRTAAQVVVFTWWCSPHKLSSSLRCVQLCATASFVWALHSIGVTTDIVPRQHSNCRARRKCSTRGATRAATKEKSQSSGEDPIEHLSSG
jgi:hypothetical protein